MDRELQKGDLIKFNDNIIGIESNFAALVLSTEDGDPSIAGQFVELMSSNGTIHKFYLAPDEYQILNDITP